MRLLTTTSIAATRERRKSPASLPGLFVPNAPDRPKADRIMSEDFPEDTFWNRDAPKSLVAAVAVAGVFLTLILFGNGGDKPAEIAQQQHLDILRDREHRGGDLSEAECLEIHDPHHISPEECKPQCGYIQAHHACKPGEEKWTLEKQFAHEDALEDRGRELIELQHIDEARKYYGGR
jgi:hypothetical protein